MKIIARVLAAILTIILLVLLTPVFIIMGVIYLAAQTADFISEEIMN